MYELTTAKPVVCYRGMNNLGAWGTAGEGGINLDWTVVPGCMNDFNNGRIEFGLVHELGHCFDARNFPRWYITPVCGGETFGNLKLSYAVEQLLRKDNHYRIEFGPGGMQTGYDFNTNFYLPPGDKYLADKGRVWTQMSVDELHSFHLRLIRKYGWDVYKKWFRTYPQMEKAGFLAPPECNDIKRMIVICAILSHYTGEDLTGYFNQWRIPVTREDVDKANKACRLNEIYPFVDAQFSKELLEGKITLDPKSMWIRQLGAAGQDGATAMTAGKVVITGVKIKGAIIRYSIGGDPTPTSPVYTAPFPMTGSGRVRAAMYLPTNLKTPVLKAEMMCQATVNAARAKPAVTASK
jgi:hypothetical protein